MKHDFSWVEFQKSTGDLKSGALWRRKSKADFVDTRNAMAGIKTADGKVWKA
jgi:hypothetical protein